MNQKGLSRLVHQDSPKWSKLPQVPAEHLPELVAVNDLIGEAVVRGGFVRAFPPVGPGDGSAGLIVDHYQRGGRPIGQIEDEAARESVDQLVGKFVQVVVILLIHVRSLSFMSFEPALPLPLRSPASLYAVARVLSCG